MQESHGEFAISQEVYVDSTKPALNFNCLIIYNRSYHGDHREVTKEKGIFDI